MSTVYIVRAGDTLTKIASQHGFADWRTIYRHPENAPFRARRPNPDRIFPGDQLVIPGAGGAAPPPTQPPVPSRASGCYCGNDPRHLASGAPATRSGRVLPFLPTSAPPPSAPAAGGAPGRPTASPKEVAMEGVPKARFWTQRAINAVFRLRFQKPGAILANPIIERSAARAHFKLRSGWPAADNPRLTIPLLGALNGSINLETEDDFLADVGRVLEEIRTTLDIPHLIFRTAQVNPFGGSPMAVTIGRKKSGFEEGTFPTGIHFFPAYCTEPGPLKKIEVIVHECAHFANNLGITDKAHPILDLPGYREETQSAALQNAYAYSQFIIHVNLGYERRLALEE